MGRKAGLPVVYRRNDGDVYWCRFTVDGKRYRQSTGKTDPGEAETVAKKIHAEVTLGRPAPSSKRLGPVSGTAFDVLSAEFVLWARTNKSQSYARKIEQHMVRFAKRWKRIPDATHPIQIERYKSERLEVVSS